MVSWQTDEVRTFAHSPRPSELNPDMNEVEARWELLRLKRAEPLAVRFDDLNRRSDRCTLEISVRIQTVRRRYMELTGVEPGRREEHRLWLREFIPITFPSG